MSDDGRAVRLLATVRDIGFISFGKYGQYVVTAVTLPLTARILGPEGLGLLAIGMSSYFIGSVLVDLGITQFLAAMMHSEDVRQLRGNYLAIRAGILGAIGSALLLGVTLDAGVAVQMILLGLFAGGFWSMSEDWVLIGQARFGASMAYQGAGRVVYLLLLIAVLPRVPLAAVALLCLLVSSVVTVGLTWIDSVRRFGRPARPHGVFGLARMGGTMLTSRLLVVGYGHGSATIYSSVLGAASLGLFSAGDRLVRGVQALLDPIGFALLPRMARIGDGARFWRRAVLAMLACVGVACVASAAIWVTAPIAIEVIFGRDFDAAVPLLRVLAFILPATALTSFVSTAILTVRQDTVGVLIGALVGIAVAGTWLYVAARTGSVWALVYGSVCCEFAVALWFVFRVCRLWMRECRASRPVATPPAGAAVCEGAAR